MELRRPCHEPEKPEEDQHRKVGRIGAEDDGPGKGEHDEHGHQKPGLDRHDARNERNRQVTDDHEHEIGKHHGNQNAEHDGALVFKELRSRPEPPSNEGSEKDRGDVVAGNAERQERHQRRAVHRVVGRFGGGDALDLALPESLGMGREAFLNAE